jgi:hypothetical protein
VVKAIRDAATLLILILLVASIRIGHVEKNADPAQETGASESRPAIHLATPAAVEEQDQLCPDTGQKPGLAVTRTRTSQGLPANCRS